MIEDLLPRALVAVEAKGDDRGGYLRPEEAAQLGGAVSARVKEFTTARTCARQALCKLGLPPVPILRGTNREPLWPQGVVGSITHCSRYRAAVLGMKSHVLTVGIDSEPDDELPSEVIDYVAVSQERAWLAKAPNGVHWDRLLFSAKESVYKAWFPLTRKFLDFKDLLVTFEPALGTFRAHLLVKPDTANGRDLSEFSGRFMVSDGLMLTATTTLL